MDAREEAAERSGATKRMNTNETQSPGSLQPDCSAADVIHLYVVEYEHGRNRYHTVVEARDIESAKRQFRRDNPDVEMLSCV